MYFSRLILNPRSQQVRRDLANLYDLHRTLMRAFPDGRAGGPGRVLWRRDVDRRTARVELLIQSEKEPTWERLLDHWPDYVTRAPQSSVPGIECKECAVSFTTGQILVFRLRANPTVKREKKRHGYFREEDQLAWLHRKAQAGGFSIMDVRVRGENSVKARRANQHQLSFLSVLFEGRLRVDDSDKISQTVRDGIGSAKAFGFGLLSLARV